MEQKIKSLPYRHSKKTDKKPGTFLYLKEITFRNLYACDLAKMNGKRKNGEKKNYIFSIKSKSGKNTSIVMIVFDIV